MVVDSNQNDLDFLHFKPFSKMDFVIPFVQSPLNRFFVPKRPIKNHNYPAYFILQKRGPSPQFKFLMWGLLKSDLS